MRRPALLWLCVLLCAASGCQQQDTLERIQARGELVVVSRNSPTTYYQGKDGPTGFEYALTALLAQALGVELRMTTAYNLREIFTELQRQDADLAAAGLTLTESRAARFPHSIPYYRLTPQVVYRVGDARPRQLSDLSQLTVAVLAGSSHADLLSTLQGSELPDLRWEEIDEADTTQLLELLDGEQADVAIVDSNEFALAQSLYPHQKVAFDLGQQQSLVWYLAPGVDNDRLLAFIDAFIERARRDGTLERLREQYFGHTDGVTHPSALTFARNVREILPPYEKLIRQVALEYGMDWHLLAAMAYQESHWDPLATSPTGVRGMMMLTEGTARAMNVDNRLDAAQSLRGGARYLKDIKRDLPGEIQEPDRTWLALAAYNIGPTHLEDARLLTLQQGGNPNLWQDVMERLPLLQKTRFYKNTRYGYARGMEAVRLVQNIRNYYSVLAWREIPDIQPQPPLRALDYMPDAIRGLDFEAL